MNRLPKILLLACLALVAPAPLHAAPASAAEAGVRTPVLANAAPGVVSVPFEIPIRQASGSRDPFRVQLSVEGFTLDPEPVAGNRIGSLDVLSASGNFGDKAIYSNGPGSGGVRTWTLDWQLSADKGPIVAEVRDGIGLSPAGETLQVPGSTLISFTVPVNYHGFPISGLDFRFNESEHGTPSPAVGAVNPSRPGAYLLRSRIESSTPSGGVDLASALARIGLPDPRTELRVRADKRRVRSGGKVRFRLHTTNETKDTVAVWLGKRRLGRLDVGPRLTYFSWRPERKLRGRKVVLSFRPTSGPVRRLAIRVSRR